uniref:Uncharacterized protein n=1 Tax=Aeromonas virus AHPMCC11 TaxID=3035930 RepID=A0AAT9TTE2_9VIRU
MGDSGGSARGRLGFTLAHHFWSEGIHPPVHLIS